MQNSTVFFQLHFSNNISFCASISRSNAKPRTVSGIFIQTLNMDATIHSNCKARFILKAFLFCVAFTGLFFLLSSTINFALRGFERLVQGTIGTVAALLTTFLFLKIDKKRFSDIGLTFEGKTVVKFFVGVFIGILIMGLLAISVDISDVRIDVNPGSNVLNFLLVTASLIPLALMEELGFRAYPLEILKDKIGIRLAIIVTSILFALYHVASSFYGPAVWGFSIWTGCHLFKRYCLANRNPLCS